MSVNNENTSERSTTVDNDSASNSVNSSSQTSTTKTTTKTSSSSTTPANPADIVKRALDANRRYQTVLHNQLSALEWRIDDVTQKRKHLNDKLSQQTSRAKRSTQTLNLRLPGTRIYHFLISFNWFLKKQINYFCLSFCVDRFFFLSLVYSISNFRI